MRKRHRLLRCATHQTPFAMESTPFNQRRNHESAGPRHHRPPTKFSHKEADRRTAPAASAGRSHPSGRRPEPSPDARKPASGHGTAAPALPLPKSKAGAPARFTPTRNLRRQPPDGRSQAQSKQASLRHRRIPRASRRRRHRMERRLGPYRPDADRADRRSHRRTRPRSPQTLTISFAEIAHSAPIPASIKAPASTPATIRSTIPRGSSPTSSTCSTPTTSPWSTWRER